MKIARIFTGDIDNRKGKFNNVIERIKHLQKLSEVESDIYIIQYKYMWLFRWLRKVPKKNIVESVTIDGIKLKMLWVRLSLLEYLLVHKLKVKDIACKKQLNKYHDLFKSYDILATHDLLSSHLASLVKKIYNIPFVVTWHGSDINKYPHRSKSTYNTIKFLLKYADYNFFVSKALMKNSDTITRTKNKTHLYSGPADNFFRKSDEEIDRLKKKLQITSKNVIGFIGNLEPIKNVMVLPEIFHYIQNQVQEETSFVVIGNGRLEYQLKEKLKSLEVSNVTFSGKILPKEVSNYLNVITVLVLPSLNEGMPLVTLEAQACNVHVVGSNVGGIPESIGERNSFALGPNFIDNISKRIIGIILNKEKPSLLSNEFSWGKTIQKEMQVYNEILHNKIK